MVRNSKSRCIAGHVTEFPRYDVIAHCHVNDSVGDKQ